MKKKLGFLENLKTQMIRNDEYENTRQIFFQETSKYEEEFEKNIQYFFSRSVIIIIYYII